jgi:hypothetical protein
VKGKCTTRRILCNTLSQNGDLGRRWQLLFCSPLTTCARAVCVHQVIIKNPQKGTAQHGAFSDARNTMLSGGCEPNLV